MRGERVHRPGLTYWGQVIMLAAMVFVAAAMFLGFVPMEGPRSLFVIAVGAVFGIPGLYITIFSWRTFRVGRDGLCVKTLRKERVHAWEDISIARRRRVRDYAHRNPQEYISGDLEPGIRVVLILDADGRPLYRLGPNYPTRRALAAEINERVLAATVPP